jgi:hypothetical protein
MSTTNQDEKFLRLFKGSLRIEARTISIKTLLSERNLKRINYTPYYQRNYVWDNIKQTFFIESVILGTEIPPLILFKSGMSIEVIDGRQRFETLKRFKDNDLILSTKGLLSLPALGRKSFNTLNQTIQNTFWDTNIRVFEFEIINEPSLEDSIEDKIKKEIFRRYNTGITPLTAVEIDNAKYDGDNLSNLIEEELDKDKTFYQNVKNCFFYNDDENADLLSQMVNYLRRCFILNQFPISKYAQGSERTEIIDLLYDFATKSLDDNINDELSKLKKQIQDVASMHNYLIDNDRVKFNNKLIFECLLWAIRILDQENIFVNLKDIRPRIKTHLDKNIDKYSQDNSHFSKSIIGRFSDIASFFSIETKFDFEMYIRNTSFKDKVKDLRQSEKELHDEIQQLDSLRINRPAPISVYIDDLKEEVKSNRYLIRPAYQRQEKISSFKASSIIESILLNIKLPPIFIYQRNDKIKEVVDGQQRLLSIIGFLGAQYINEKNDLSFSKNNAFKLKGLKILTELNGKNYSELTQDQKDKILDFIIDEIIIEERINENFEPTDLFIRLNQKPYPIQQNSFEMWNSTVDKEVIQKIKDIANKHVSWFFSKEIKTSEERTDRMENEELITILSYILYNNVNNKYDKVLGLFQRQDRITCRIKDKNVLTDFLNKLEKNVNEKELFIKSIDKTDELISQFGQLLNNPTKESFNSFLNVKDSQQFRRSYQDFYVIWLILDKMPISSDNTNTILDSIKLSLKMLKNAENNHIDDTYMDNFKRMIAKDDISI